MAAAEGRCLLAHERATLAVGRLDATAALSPAGLRELLVLRCSVVPFAAASDGMIAILRRDREGRADVEVYHEAIRKGASRARGGVVPTVELLRNLAGNAAGTVERQSVARLRRVPSVDAGDGELNTLIRDAATPPVLRSVVVSGALLAREREHGVLVASLASSLLLCVGGATVDAWLALPMIADERLLRGPGEDNAEWGAWLEPAFDALALEAGSAVRGLGEARRRIDEDRVRVREAFARSAYSALDLLELLARDLVVTVPDAARALGQTPPTAGAAVARLVALGIAEEITGRRRARAFVYRALVDALAPRRGPLPSP